MTAHSDLDHNPVLAGQGQGGTASAPITGWGSSTGAPAGPGSSLGQGGRDRTRSAHTASLAHTTGGERDGSGSFEVFLDDDFCFPILVAAVLPFVEEEKEFEVELGFPPVQPPMGTEAGVDEEAVAQRGVPASVQVVAQRGVPVVQPAMGTLESGPAAPAQGGTPVGIQPVQPPMGTVELAGDWGSDGEGGVVETHRLRAHSMPQVGSGRAVPGVGAGPAVMPFGGGGA